MTIFANNFSFRFDKDEKWVLKNLSFEISSGGTVAIVGASGCGKSTLLRLLAGVLPNSKENESTGSLLIDNKTPSNYRTENRIAFIFQEPTLLPHFTVKQNVQFPLDFVPNGENLKTKVDSLLKEVGVSQYQDSFPSILSGGTKARVALAQSFALGPSLLLLDEPFSSLDVGWRHQLYLQLERLKNKSQTSVFLVTHDIEEALRLADRVIVLGIDGTLLKEYSLKSEGEINSVDVNTIINDILIKHPAKIN